MTDDLISRADAIAAIATCGDSAVTEALGQRICCNGQMCGCHGATVEDVLVHAIRALPAYEVAVKPLAWRQIGDFGWIATDELCNVGVTTLDPDVYDAERADRINSALTAAPAADVAGLPSHIEVRDVKDQVAIINTHHDGDDLGFCAIHREYIPALIAALARMKEAKA